MRCIFCQVVSGAERAGPAAADTWTRPRPTTPPRLPVGAHVDFQQQVDGLRPVGVQLCRAFGGHHADEEERHFFPIREPDVVGLRGCVGRHVSEASGCSPAASAGCRSARWCFFSPHLVLKCRLHFVDKQALDVLFDVRKELQLLPFPLSGLHGFGGGRRR